MPITVQPTVAVQHVSSLFSEVQYLHFVAPPLSYALQLSAVIGASGPHTQV